MARKILFPLCFVLALALTSCAPAGQTAAQDDGTTHLVATTYPVYLFTSELVKGAEGITVDLMIDQPISCLHDYTLTVQNMRTLEEADVILISGAGLEDFLDDALSSLNTPVIDCSAGISLLPYQAQDGHDHGHDDHDDEDEDTDETDPHIWMDPNRAVQMLDNIALGLAEVQTTYSYEDLLAQMRPGAEAISRSAKAWQDRFAALSDDQRRLITFHDGFGYLAAAFDLDLLKAIEEESGSEASAKDIREIVELVRQYDLPMIFVEENGSSATAEAIARETGVEIGTLSMMMSDNGSGYLQTMERNLRTIYEGLTGEEVPQDGE